MDNKNQREKVVLYKSKSSCCGCGACMNICPKQAILMRTDEYGFIYPQIDESICINCGQCKKVCGYQSESIRQHVNDTYIAVAKDKKTLNGSASGGVFAVMATEVINRGGVAFGCSMEQQNGKLTPEHIMIDTLSDLMKLQGSKYVQSRIGNTYILAKEQLKQNRLVLFSGTPCQIDGLNHFLNMKHYDNLITVDLICHGVPNAQMFQDYIAELEKKLGGPIVDFKFRDKTNGWGYYNTKVIYKNANKTLSKSLPCDKVSYYELFLKSVIYRENCYSCKYANANRVGDLTIGDYWGVEAEHPQYLKTIDVSKGVSCIIVNNDHGRTMLKELCSGMELLSSNFEKASRANAQLNHPSQKSERRESVLELYKNSGYAAVEKWYIKSQGIRHYMNLIKGLLPYKLKSKLKRLIKR